jgi:hypothetical protein
MKPVNSLPLEFLYFFWRTRVECDVNSFHIRLATYPTTNLASNPQSRQSAQSASVPLWFRRGTHSLPGEGTKGQTLLYSRYSVIPLRTNPTRVES